MTPMTVEIEDATLRAAGRWRPAEDWHGLIRAMAPARLVLMGEATHGTREFYRTRIELTKRLIVEEGFKAVAWEADWPAAYRVNCFVRGVSDDPDAGTALDEFHTFPNWMWRNQDILEFVNWLRAYNDSVPTPEKVGVYGLDLYSLHTSLEAVLRYLDRVDPEEAERARERYACFDGGSGKEYGYAQAMGLQQNCEQAALEQLLELQRKRAEYAAQDGRIAVARQFHAEQNAKLVQDAEAYYRAMYRGGENTWNLRDTHMADTLDALMTYLSEGSNPARIVVWAHNSHLGDARATEMGEEGELNLGQLTRERHPGASFHLGFSTYWGTVTAASRWGAPPQHKSVLRALKGSVEDLMHEAGHGTNGYLLMHEDRDLEVGLAPERLERAIGVIYRPESERWSHYFHASLSRQFDALMHFDRSFAVEPLDHGPEWSPHPEDAPETFPSGL